MGISRYNINKEVSKTRRLRGRELITPSFFSLELLCTFFSLAGIIFPEYLSLFFILLYKFLFLYNILFQCFNSCLIFLKDFNLLVRLFTQNSRTF